MTILATMEQKIQQALTPVSVQLRDDSGAHYGHDGATPGQISHVAMRVVAAAFTGKSRVERSRMVYGAVADEIREIHAVTSLVTLTPEEAGVNFPAGRL